MREIVSGWKRISGLRKFNPENRRGKLKKKKKIHIYINIKI